MTPFEKALLGELKGIRKELSKLNARSGEDPVRIPPPPDAIVQQVIQSIQLQQQQVELDVEEIAKHVGYDPLGNG